MGLIMVIQLMIGILSSLKDDMIENRGGYVVAAAFWILIVVVLILLHGMRW